MSSWSRRTTTSATGGASVPVVVTSTDASDAAEQPVAATPFFDIVIPVGPNDVALFYTQLHYTKQNIIGYRNIYVVTAISLDPAQTQGCQTIEESIFPFSLQTVGEYIHAPERRGWYLQQLLKLSH